MRRRALFLIAVFALASAGCNEATLDPGVPQNVFVPGNSATVEGKTVSTWAETDAMGNPRRVGVTMDAALVSTPPSNPGPGPLGAVAVLQFPDAIRSRTPFNHLELHWNPMGHEPGIYMEPHFDFHYYFIPEAEVRAIAPPDPQAPSADRIPTGYVYPGVNAAVPQMGTHAAPVSDFQPGYHFDKTMILGYWNGQMIFVEPMITQAFLQAKNSYSLPVPVPTVLGRSTMYPTRFNATYDAARNVWNFVFSDFVSKS